MGRSDTPLNSRGKAQAAAIAEVLKKFQVDFVYTSPQFRARETAEVIAKAKNQKVEVEFTLSEVDFPRWIGKTLEEIKSDPSYEAYRGSHELPYHEHFETIRQVYERTSKGVEKRIQENPDKNLVFVSHADPLRAILSYFLRYPLSEFRRFQISNASLTLLDRFRDRWQLKLFNYRTDIIEALEVGFIT